MPPIAIKTSREEQNAQFSLPSPEEQNACTPEEQNAMLAPTYPAHEYLCLSEVKYF
jgi:hypothetical protein